MPHTLPLLVAFALGPIAGPAPPPEVPVRAFFGPAAADDPDGLFLNLMRFLDSAERSIHASVHEIDMIAVAEKLAARAAEGLEVRLVVESDWWDTRKSLAARRVLDRSRVRVTPDTKKSGLMHNKFFVVDGKRVWTGSANLTETCLFFNPNHAVWVEDGRVAANFTVEFREQEAGGFGKRGSGPPNTPFPVVAVRGGHVETYFAPEDEPLGPIVALIDRADSSVDVMCFVLSSEEVAEALKRAHSRGVRVRVLLDNAFSSDAITARWRYVPFRELSAAGVACKYDDRRSKLHHKCVIVDRKAVVCGSMNLSAGGARENDENVLIVRVPSVAARFAAEFERLWAEYPGGPGRAPRPDPEDFDG